MGVEWISTATYVFHELRAKNVRGGDTSIFYMSWSMWLHVHDIETWTRTYRGKKNIKKCQTNHIASMKNTCNKRKNRFFKMKRDSYRDGSEIQKGKK